MYTNNERDTVNIQQPDIWIEDQESNAPRQDSDLA